jgi:hypothetical protein
MKKLIKRTTTPLLIVPLLFGLCLFAGAAYAADKPNILVIWGDDIGHDNISAYNRAMLDYDTPNIDRIANVDEKNWIQSIPGRAQLIAIRLYGSETGFFDQTWKPDDVIRVK